MADQFAQDRNMVPDSRAEFEALENAQEAMKQAHQHLLFADACGGVTVFDSHAIQETCEALHGAIEGLKPIQVATQRQQERIAELEAQVKALSLDAGRLDWIAMHGSFGVDSVTGLPGGNGQKHKAATRAAIDAAIAAGKGEA